MLFSSCYMDLFHHAGREYLVIRDKYSGWAEVYDCGRGVSTEDVCQHILAWCMQLGVPRRLASDGGPQFKSKEFAEFCTTWGIKHDPSSPHHHESNGFAEDMVKSMKRMVQRIAPNGKIGTPGFFNAMLEYRNTPRKEGVSPAQRLFVQICAVH
ncbi:uncharacterized protein K02A2.6-like [Tigriopus californicus]|uniref:uncharacterized protein K02A2.6-like n=1 Tax=Tigriopus californicus TaxID=6832 RepID=UPI0027D9F44D|nr:uncharacterized protein K02A2.6-like [Tigriopus californicus]